ncbi:PREDICTED: probable serine/threonine-protein kinase At1g54610 [Tarenaya hassleriana]|uniref:probable serine/threonine-protein kinase At1g54610 n=1 Tax=Tarenaya hassleriana TaxID=28532 RepID=UPI00053C1CF4|nr:PREDICTED: probable serine/threonine-protein kinase At1g54610 [Tarenaya hassleriana]
MLQQLLHGLDHWHTLGVLHGDIKDSNLLIDNNGVLKIADFGLACFFDPRQTLPLTSRVVTLWYRPPELLLGATHNGVVVDLWSTGCILAELYADARWNGSTKSSSYVARLPMTAGENHSCLMSHATIFSCIDVL